MPRFRVVPCFCSFLILSASLVAQNPGTGLYAFGSFDNRGFDSINVGNLNIHFEIPIVAKTGRGLPFNYSIVYDGLMWNVAGASGLSSWTPDPGWGFHDQVNGTNTIYASYAGYLTYSQGGWSCPMVGSRIQIGDSTSNYVYHDPYGKNHQIKYSTHECPLTDADQTIVGDGSTSDGSGVSYGINDGLIHTANGSVITPAYSGVASNSTSDSNGNTITDNGVGVFTDTLGKQVLTIAGGSIGPRTYTYNVANQADSSTTATITESYKQYTVQTNFSCSDSSGAPIAQYGPQQNNLPDRVTLPDGTFYQFNYEATPGVNGAVTGRLSSITLPTGGTISYNYWGGCDGNGLNPDGTTGEMSRITSDGTRQYLRGPSTNGSTTTLQNENNDQTTYTFTNVGGLFYETHHTVWTGNASANLNLSDVYTCYNGTGAPCDGVVISPPITQVTAISSQNGGAQRSVTNTYEASGSLLASNQVYDYGGALLQRTDYLYASLGRVSSTTVTDGSGNRISQAVYGYDEQPPTATSNLPQHNAVSGPRGNQTSSHLWLNTTNTNVDTSTTYDDAGQVISTQDARGNKTTYSYDPTDTFVTSIMYPIPGNGNNTTIATGAQYDPASGVLLSTTDANNQTTTYRTYDRFLRPTEIDFPDGGKKTATYNFKNTLGLFQSSILTAINPTTNADTEIEYDGYGRTIRLATLNGQGGTTPWNQIDYCYDAVGNLHFQSAPYSNTGFNVAIQCAGVGTTIGYDALGRQTSASMPDGISVQGLSYNSNTYTKKDEAGNPWQYTLDGLGRTTKVIEPNSAETDYVYTDFTTTVKQKGVSVETPRPDRVFTSDSLGRIVNVNTPESGTTAYVYDNNGNPFSMTDARGITTTYTFDALNRMTAETSSDGSITHNWTYDLAVVGGGAFNVANPIGRLGEMATPDHGTSEQFSYDAMGRVILQANTLPSTCCDLASQVGDAIKATYDWAGNITSLTYPDGRVITQGFDAGNNLQNVTFDNWNGQHVGYNYASGFTYTAAGSPQSMTLGNGAIQTFNLNNRLQPSEIQVHANAGGINQTVFDKQYKYTSSCQSANNGNIMQIIDPLNNARSQGFCYDNLNRLAAFSNGDASMQQSYSYDSFGNLNQNGTLSSSLIYGSNNQIISSGFVNDSAGNLIQTSTGIGTPPTFAYDARNNLTSVNNGAASYVYDPLNNRVRKNFNGDWREYVYFNGQTLAEKHSDGTWSDYIYANGQMIAKAAGSDTRIHMSGTTVQAGYELAGLIAIPSGIVVRAGDRLAWRQYNTGGAVGGVNLLFSNGGSMSWHTLANDNEAVNQNHIQDVWQYRTAPLDEFVNATITEFEILKDVLTSPGNWSIYLADISIVRADGTVIPLFTDQISPTPGAFQAVNTSYDTSFGATVETVSLASDPTATPGSNHTTHFYIGDHLGSTRMVMANGGWPVSTSTFYPFGQEQSPMSGPDHYKYASLERDQENGETGLDHATFRQYSSTMGRWMSPDPYMGSYDFADPQSFNRYSYALNNPLKFTDPLGLQNCAGGPDVNTPAEWEDCLANPACVSEGCVTTPYPCGGDQFCMTVTNTPNPPVNVNPPNPGIPPSLNSEPFNPGGGNDSSGGGGGGSAPSSCPGTPSSVLPHGVAIVGGAEGTAGIASGATIQGSGGYGWFASSTGGVNSGWFGSFIAAGRFGPWVKATNPQGRGRDAGSPIPLFAGGYGGAGAGLMVTNAQNVQQLGGPFTSIQVSLPAASLNFSFGGGVWTASWTAGPGAYGAVSITTTPTKPGSIHGPC